MRVGMLELYQRILEHSKKCSWLTTITKEWEQSE